MSNQPRPSVLLPTLALFMVGSVLFGASARVNEDPKLPQRIVDFERVEAQDSPGGWLGVHIQDLSPTLAEGVGLGDRRGVLISDVQKGAPADEAGVKAEDVILRVDGEPVDTTSELQRRIRAKAPGESAILEVWRSGEPILLEVTLGRQAPSPQGYAPPADHQAFASRSDQAPGVVRFFGREREDPGPTLGVMVAELTEGLAGYFEAEPGEGVLILEVLAESAAEEAGLEAGDVIRELDGRPIRDPEGLRRAIRKVGPGQIEVEYLREGQVRTAQATLSAADGSKLRQSPGRAIAPWTDHLPRLPKKIPQTLRRFKEETLDQGQESEVARRELMRLRAQLESLKRDLEDLKEDLEVRIKRTLEEDR